MKRQTWFEAFSVLVVRQDHFFSASLNQWNLCQEDCCFKFTEKGSIRWQFGKIKFVWDTKILIGKNFFSSASFLGFEKWVQSTCATQKLHYAENLYISKFGGNQIVSFFWRMMFLVLYRGSNRGLGRTWSNSNNVHHY